MSGQVQSSHRRVTSRRSSTNRWTKSSVTRKKQSMSSRSLNRCITLRRSELSDEKEKIVVILLLDNKLIKDIYIQYYYLHF